MGEAARPDLADLAAVAARQPQLAAHVVEARTGGEGRQGPQAEAHRLDVESDRQAARGRTLRGQARTPHHRHGLGVQGGHLQPPMQQRAIVPVDDDVVSLEPRPVFVRDGELANGEVAPDVAPQALDLQLAHPAQHQAADPRFDQQAGARRQHAVAQGGHRQDENQQPRGHEGQGPARGGARSHRLRPPSDRSRRGGVGRRAQKLCPMLM